MKLKLVLFFVMVQSLNAFAALPPQFQNSKDLGTMMDWLNLPENEVVLSHVKTISLENYSITYLNPNQEGTCEVLFKREEVSRPRGWAGPASGLIFNKIACE